MSSYPTYTRRWLLELAASVGGLAGVVRAASALELMPGNGNAAPLQLARISVPRHVVIVGAGIAGLVSAVELRRAGYAVTVIEASHRLGGRVLTLRHGDRVDEIGNRQVCQFDREPHLYFNAGASRIPSVHSRILGYCAALGIGLETHVNASSAAWLQYDDFNSGGRVRQREFNADARVSSRSWRRAPCPLPCSMHHWTAWPGNRRWSLSCSSVTWTHSGATRDPSEGPDRKAVGASTTPAQASPRAAPKNCSRPITGAPRCSLERARRSRPCSSRSAEWTGSLPRWPTSFLAGSSSRRRSSRSARLIVASRSRAARTRPFEPSGRIYCLNSMPGQILAGIDHNFTGHVPATAGGPASRQSGKDRLADAREILGTGGNLWRHFLDQSGHRPDPVSLPRLRSAQGHRGRGLLPATRSTSALQPDVGR
ncbi:MAG: NAD(P)-binding protein [Proteobacteria bacterium]|nr:NAD(P)-binding protein [Pseudomonadota bacterium]